MHTYYIYMRRKVFILQSLMMACILLGTWSCGHPSDVVRDQIDSLNLLAYQSKYRSLEEASKYVDEVLVEHADAGYVDGLHEAWLNRGDILGMRMDYDSAQFCYQKVLSESNNDLLCSLADVDMMSVCLMTSMSKEFYDYRSDAHERFASVEEAVDDMTPHQQLLWNAVQTQYHFVSVNYFMKMRQDEGVYDEFQWLEQHQDIFSSDTTQWAAYLFLQSLNSGQNEDTPNAEEEMQRNLLRLLSVSRQQGYVYFVASALNSLAREAGLGGGMRPSRQVFLREQLNEIPHADNLSEDELCLLLARQALLLARQYGNAFVETTALVTLSDYYLQHGQDSLALVQMEQALALINEHHFRGGRYKNEESDSLVVYDSTMISASNKDDIMFSTEMKWIADPAVMAVPDWMVMVREQLSIVYGAMGKKAESDYNHNICFDILDATRQDLRVQQEEEHLKREEHVLNLLLWVLAFSIVVLAWLLYLYHRRSGERYRHEVDRLRRVIDVCKKLPSALLQEVGDEKMLDATMHEMADQEVEALFPQLRGKDWTRVDTDTMKGLDKEMMGVLQMFYNWIRQKGLQYVQMTEQQWVLESEACVDEKRLEDNKRKYVEKLTYMSIVNGITPFLDRALHEVQKLKADKTESEAVVRERLQYVRELIGKINEYNDVLGHWVKIRQGEVMLHVESFNLQPLFDTLKRSTKIFETNHITLNVKDTESVVKADKALTLFMMNTLLDNARKYTPAGGQVTLSAEETADYVEVMVEDTGHGMSAEDVETLNKSKVYNSQKIGVVGTHADDILRNKGFGFGLMNCKGIIGKYKKTNSLFSVCEFGVESELGKGSRFFFRLPKGVVRAVMCMVVLWLSAGTLMAKNKMSGMTDMERAKVYADSIFSANVAGDHERAILYADSAIQRFNHCVHSEHPKEKAFMVLEGAAMGEQEWWKRGYKVDYELLISIRNEVAIAALALNRNSLYHYNSEACTRLYKLTSTDATLEDYCNEIRMANRNKKTTVIVLGVLLLLGVVVYFLLHYRNNQLFIFNLRQFIQLNNSVFTATEQDLPKVLRQGLSDIKPTDVVGIWLPQEGQVAKGQFWFDGKQNERNLYESVMLSAYTQQREMTGGNGCFHAYPLVVLGTDEEIRPGVLGVCFNDGKLTDEEMLIMRQVVQFMSIYTYFSRHKVEEMNELLELWQDKRLRIAAEMQKVYVRNQIMDNCLSTLKHETMYYPHRIRQLVDQALAASDVRSIPDMVDDIDELLNYYKEIFSILCACAGKQVEMVLFKRVKLSGQDIVKMAQQAFKRLGKKSASSANIRVSVSEDVVVLGDKIFLQTLVDNIIMLFFEHHSGGDMQLNFAVSEGFAKFAFTDTAYRYDEEDLPQLFYIDNVKYDTKSDTLVGTQYLICRQIVREHDAYSPRRGCRIYVENTSDEQGSTFVFTLPLATLGRVGQEA